MSDLHNKEMTLNIEASSAKKAFKKLKKEVVEKLFAYHNSSAWPEICTLHMEMVGTWAEFSNYDDLSVYWSVKCKVSYYLR